MRLRLLFSLLVLVAAVVFTLRRATLREAQAEAAKLRDSIEPAAPLAVRPPSPAPAPGPTGTEALSAEERRELVRLRGEVGALRAAWAEAARTPVPAEPVSPPPGLPTEPGEPTLPRGEVVTRMNQGKQWMLALIIHAQSNQGRLPAGLEEVASLLGPAVKPEDQDRFELMLQGALEAVPAPATTIVLREKRPWRSGRDRWSRIYAFADGHVETATSATEDFQEWEESRRASAGPAARP